MTIKKVLLIQGHPDRLQRHLGHVLQQAYADGAMSAGHHVRQLEVASFDFPLLRSQEDWLHGELPACLKPAQDDIAWAEHIVIFFPLWMGDMPALLKGFLEQLARPGFAFQRDQDNPFGTKALGGRSARLVVTMGMPATVYRLYFRAHSVKSLERNILGMVGIAPVHETLIGQVERLDAKAVHKLSTQVRKLGVEAT
jgi:putative NADPH-quinone reductase